MVPALCGLLPFLLGASSCEDGAIKMLADMRQREAEAMKTDGMKIDSTFYARVNAQVSLDPEWVVRGE